MTVKELMSTALCTIDPETTLAVASTLMAERHIGSALVCDATGHLVGILTERDVVRAMSHAHDAPLRPVAEWMTRNPVTATADMGVKDALRTMVDAGFRHLPIVDDGRPVGIVSIRDIARDLSE